MNTKLMIPLQLCSFYNDQTLIEEILPPTFDQFTTTNSQGKYTKISAIEQKVQKGVEGSERGGRFRNGWEKWVEEIEWKK